MSVKKFSPVILSIVYSILVLCCCISFGSRAAVSPITYDDKLLEQLRQLATPKNGESDQLPMTIHITKVADTIRPASVVIKGAAAAQKMTLARSVYQLHYADDHTVMIDSGMDYKTHRTFGKTEEPFYQDNYQQVQQALIEAQSILITHYHADHVAGVINSPNFEALAGKTHVSTDTLKLMLNKPHKPTATITLAQAKQFAVYDYQQFHRVAAGVVLFRTPGHTTDSKMLYLKLANGQEFIHSVDSGWSMQNIVQEKMKNASWVKENDEQLLAQYHWLNQLMLQHPDIQVLCTHDNEQFGQLIASGVLKKGLHLKPQSSVPKNL